MTNETESTETVLPLTAQELNEAVEPALSHAGHIRNELARLGCSSEFVRRMTEDAYENAYLTLVLGSYDDDGEGI